MCGIVGYVGDKDAAPVIMDSLRRLEYRGYDSSGMAVLFDGNVDIRRSVGKLDNLYKLIINDPPKGNIGIGHTRWATHGEPSDRNAHPHCDCSKETVVIHNGIVENYVELKRELLKEGHCFASDTDSEVIAHLIEKYLSISRNFDEAFRQTLKRIKGAHAVVAINQMYPDRILAARLGNAGGVVLGLGENEMFVASDITAIIEYTRNVLFLESGDIAVVNKYGANISNIEGESVKRSVTTIAWDPISAAKGGYRHFMLKEIFEQPRSAADTIGGRIHLDPPSVIFEWISFSEEYLRSIKRIIICACGTALHAGLVAKFYLEELAGVPVEVDYASEFRYREKLLDLDTLMISVTQSGETVDTLFSMEAAKERGVKVLSVVNVVGSQASRIADSVIYTHAGPEIGVASTKAFTSQLIALYMWALYLGNVRGYLTALDFFEALNKLAELPKLIGETLEMNAENYEILAEKYHKVNDFLYLGRGINYPIALEGALKMKEISYIHAEGYPAGEMKHGPLALVDEDMPVVTIAPQDNVYSKIISNIEQVRARHGKVIAIANYGDADILSKVDDVIWIPKTSKHLTPVLTVIPLQILAYHVAVLRGCDVDQPRNLAKSVTVE